MFSGRNVRGYFTKTDVDFGNAFSVISLGGTFPDCQNIGGDLSPPVPMEIGPLVARLHAVKQNVAHAHFV